MSLTQVDAAKAPGYRGTAVCSPVSSKTSSNTTTPPTLPLAPGSSFQGANVFSAEQCVSHSSGPVITMAAKQPSLQVTHSGLTVTRPGSSSNTLDIHPNSVNSGTNLSVGIVGQQPSSHMDVSGGTLAPSPFGNRAVFQSGGELPPRTVVSSQQHGIMVSSSQSTLDHGALYTPVSTPAYGPDPQSHNAALLKMVPGGSDPQSTPQQQQPQQQPQQQQQQQQQHPMLSSYHHQHSHHHPMNYSQPKPNLGVSSSQVTTNTTVTMSRLNPSAPDFSLHLANKPQQQQQQQPPPPPPPQQQQQPQQPQQQQPVPPPPPQQGGSMFSATATFHQRTSMLPPSSLQTSASALGTMLPSVSFPLGKSSLGPYHHQPLPGPGPAPGPAANGQRWPLFQAQYHHPHHPPDVINQMSFSGNMAHLASLAGLTHPGNSGAAVDILAGLENGAMVGGGNSPAMSPSSPASANPVPANEPNHHKLEDRKIPPRPIGTERASWKNNYGNISGVGAGADLDPNWMLSGAEPKMPVSSWIGTGMSHTMERHQIYRASASHYGRLPQADELQHMMDAGFQVHKLDLQKHGTLLWCVQCACIIGMK